MSRFNPVLFGEITLSPDKPFLIAEAGVNHENSMDVAMRMIVEAAHAGADAIKFQSYKASKLASIYSPSYWDLSKEKTKSQFELFSKYDHFITDDYRTLAKKAEEENILFMTTPFDEQFADELIPLMPWVKIASADITNEPLLMHCARKGKPILLSTGASTNNEIRKALLVLNSGGAKEIALMHCVLSYPTKPENANLEMIRGLIDNFPGHIIGYSDHVPPMNNCIALTTAWLLGARILEKHFTLDKSKPGNDHYHAMDPADIRNFRNECALVDSMLGMTEKMILPCESESIKQARRSLVFKNNFSKGHLLKDEDLLVKRPGTGISPSEILDVRNKKLKQDVAKDELLQWSMFE